MGNEVQKRGNMTIQQQQAVMMEEVAAREGIPISGLTILGGKPYINVTGLDVKMSRMAEEKGYDYAGITTVALKEPTAENKFLAGRKSVIHMFDKMLFSKALNKAQNTTLELVKMLREAYTYTFEGEGWASPESCEAIAYKYEGSAGSKKKVGVLVENVIMMAERRASNRAKREFTGTGMTTIDEIPADAGSTMAGENVELPKKPVDITGYAIVAPPATVTEVQTKEAPVSQAQPAVEQMQPEVNMSAAESERREYILEIEKWLGDTRFPEDKRMQIKQYISLPEAKLKATLKRCKEILQETAKADREVKVVEADTGKLDDGDIIFGADPYSNSGTVNELT